MNVTFFGTYDVGSHPRVEVLREGLATLGYEVREINRPLGVSTAERVDLLSSAAGLPRFLLRLLHAWSRLAAAAVRARRRTDAVVVGYLGLFDVHLARVLWPRRPIVLDHLVSAADTARDRRSARPLLLRGLEALDGWALRAASIVVVDTEEQHETVPPRFRRRCVVVPVGAPDAWFASLEPRPAGRPLRVVFFGLYTPLQGAPFIGRALAMLAADGVDVEVTMIGAGQDLEATRAAAAGADVDWRRWVDPTELPAVVADHDVCLGIFGMTPKAARVVPNKVFQGAAAGCAIVTSDTPVQRRALADAALYVPAGDPQALAAALADLAADPVRVRDLREAAASLAAREFRPAMVVRPLAAALDRVVGR